jgi:hypothetical protein
MGSFIDLGPKSGGHAKAAACGRLFFVGYPNGERTQASADRDTVNNDMIEWQQFLALDGKHDTTTRRRRKSRL